MYTVSAVSEENGAQRSGDLILMPASSLAGNKWRVLTFSLCWWQSCGVLDQLRSFRSVRSVATVWLRTFRNQHHRDETVSQVAHLASWRAPRPCRRSVAAQIVARSVVPFQIRLSARSTRRVDWRYSRDFNCLMRGGVVGGGHQSWARLPTQRGHRCRPESTGHRQQLLNRFQLSFSNEQSALSCDG